VLNVLIADDHAIVRRGLREILRESGEQTLVGEASNGAEALRQALAGSWDVVVLDITMPELSGFEALQEIKQQRPEQVVIMLSMHDSPAIVKHCLKAGAAGYLSKETAPDELVAAIHAVLRGETYLSENLRQPRAGDDPARVRGVPFG
jgi:DNA-binding NarL/FixJ family response regulator